MPSKKISQGAMLSCLAIVFGYIEHLFPLPIPIYGIKVGISNTVILSTLYILGAPMAFIIVLIKSLCQSLLFSGISSFFYSFSGGVLSLIIMYILKKTKKFSPLGISIAGGVFHNIGQLTIAAVILKSINVFYYLPVLIFFGILSGTIIGIITKIILKRIAPSYL